MGSGSKCKPDLVPLNQRFAANRSTISFQNFKQDFEFKSVKKSSNSVEFKDLQHSNQQKAQRSEQFCPIGEMTHQPVQPRDDHRGCRLPGQNGSNDEQLQSEPQNAGFNSRSQDEDQHSFVESIKSPTVYLGSRTSSLYKSQSINFKLFDSQSEAVDKMNQFLDEAKINFPQLGPRCKIFEEDLGKPEFSGNRQTNQAQKQKASFCDEPRDYNGLRNWIRSSLEKADSLSLEHREAFVPNKNTQSQDKAGGQNSSHQGAVTNSLEVDRTQSK